MIIISYWGTISVPVLVTNRMNYIYRFRDHYWSLNFPLLLGGDLAPQPIYILLPQMNQFGNGVTFTVTWGRVIGLVCTRHPAWMMSYLVCVIHLYVYTDFLKSTHNVKKVSFSNILCISYLAGNTYINVVPSLRSYGIWSVTVRHQQGRWRNLGGWSWSNTFLRKVWIKSLGLLNSPLEAFRNYSNGRLLNLF